MPKLAEFHRLMDVGYRLPDSFGPLYAVRKAVVDENGEILGMATLKLTAEAFVWLDPSRSAIKRAKTIKSLNETCANAAKSLGLDDVSCWIPPKLIRCFSGALKKLRWQKSPWRNFTFVVK